MRLCVVVLFCAFLNIVPAFSANCPDTPTAMPLTDEQKKACLQQGKPLVFDEASPHAKESPQSKAARTIRAAWLRDLIDKSAPAHPIKVPILIRNANIEGNVALHSVTFEDHVSIVNSDFQGEVNFSVSTFKQSATFDGSTFGRMAGFANTHADRDLSFSKAHFKSFSIFNKLRVERSLIATGAEFNSPDFREIEIGGALLFGETLLNDPAQFHGVALFNRAHVGLDADFCGVEFEHAAEFRSVRIDGSASFCQFGTKPVRFRSYADFEGAQAKGSVDFDFAEFDGEANFPHITVGREASFEGAHFRNKADFRNATIQGLALFGSPTADHTLGSHAKLIRTYFDGHVDFTGAHMLGGADFAGAEFKREARFQDIQAGGDLLFGSNVKPFRTRFHGPAIFSKALVKGNLSMGESQFDKTADFDGIQILGDASFALDKAFSSVSFGGKASFVGARIQGSMDLRGVRFEKDVTFHLTRVGGPVLVQPNSKTIATMFKGSADLVSMVFGSETTFHKTEFHGPVHFDNADFHGPVSFQGAQFLPSAPVSFQGAHFERRSSFQAASVGSSIDFSSVIADNDVLLQGAKFAGPASFLYAHFHIVNFGTESGGTTGGQKKAEFDSSIDLRGFTYESIVAPWRDLLGKQRPFDRQPYTQLEKTFRSSGLDNDADDVYYKRREVEGNGIGHKEVLPLLWDRSLRYLSGYGVTIWPLVLIAFLVLFVGSFVFSRLGAVICKSTNASATTHLPSDKAESHKAFVELHWFDALAVSLRILSGIDLPAGSDWVPSNNLFIDWRIFRVRYSTYATVQRIVGLLLVPIAAAAFAAAFHRPGP